MYVTSPCDSLAGFPTVGPPLLYCPMSEGELFGLALLVNHPQYKEQDPDYRPRFSFSFVRKNGHVDNFS